MRHNHDSKSEVQRGGLCETITHWLMAQGTCMALAWPPTVGCYQWVLQCGRPAVDCRSDPHTCLLCCCRCCACCTCHPRTAVDRRVLLERRGVAQAHAVQGPGQQGYPEQHQLNHKQLQELQRQAA
jgi:hypothetical protein